MFIQFFNKLQFIQREYFFHAMWFPVLYRIETKYGSKNSDYLCITDVLRCLKTNICKEFNLNNCWALATLS